MVLRSSSVLACGLLAAALLAGGAGAEPVPPVPVPVPAPLAGPSLAAPQAFSFDTLAARAAALSRSAYAAAPVRQPEVLERIDYDAHWQIRYRPAKTLHVGAVPVQFFHLGTYFRQPVRMFLLEGGSAREVVYAPALFEMPKDSPARALAADAGFAGFRLMRPDLSGDWISFLGASYFRTEGSEGQYGLSARGLAVDTGLPKGEEFPRFTEIYLQAAPEGQTIVMALLESRSVTGAYRMVISNAPGRGQVMEVQTRLYPRAPIARLGIAPLTSMFWYGESNRAQSLDWRPEVHDSDGLMIVQADGSQIWRPLDNPGQIETTRFAGAAPKGFGLLQRDRDFEHYQDDGVFYDRRPSVWVEPVSEWGAGAVQLVELPTHDEIYDNIVAFWSPAQVPQPGAELRFDYRLHWAAAPPGAGPLARTVATRIGHGGNAGQKRPKDQIKVVLDFDGPGLRDLTQDDGVTPQVALTGGDSGAGLAGMTILNPFAYPVRGTTRWRLVFDLQTPPGTQTVDLRAGLTQGGRALTETWAGRVHPDQIERRR